MDRGGGGEGGGPWRARRGRARREAHSRPDWRGLRDPRDFDGPTGKARRAGGTRPGSTGKDPTPLSDLRLLLEPATMGDPTRPLSWVSESHEFLGDFEKPAAITGRRADRSRSTSTISRTGTGRSSDRDLHSPMSDSRRDGAFARELRWGRRVPRGPQSQVKRTLIENPV